MRAFCFLAISAYAVFGETIRITLNNGVQMPVLAFGANKWDPETCENSTAEALAAGFRFVWSSALVGSDCQAAQARAIAASSIPRNELFIAGTVNSKDCTDETSCYTATKTGADTQYNSLNVSTLDMLMLDYPSTSGCSGILGQWQPFAKLYSKKAVRTIAVSNFNETQLECLQKNSLVMPSVNQLPYSVGHGHDTIVEMNAKFNVVVQAWSPLANGSLASDPMLQNIGQNHNKSAAQVGLRWVLQHNVTINTQSRNALHLQDDTNIFDFNLTSGEMTQLDNHQ